MPGCCEEGCARATSTLMRKLFRRKLYCEPGTNTSGSTPHVWQLLVTGLVPALPLAFLVVPPLVVTDLAGPSAILGVLLAAVTAVFSGMCLGELRFRLGRVQGDEYTYLYHTVGELPAFLIGWSYLLYHVTITSALARAASQSLDCLTGNMLLNYTTTHVGELPSLGSVPDFLSLVVVLVSALLLQWAPWWQGLVNYVICGVVGLAAIFVLIVGVFHSRLESWAAGSGFFPYRANGVWLAAGAIFFCYDGVQSTLSSTQTGNTPGQVLTSWASILTSVTLAAFGTSGVTSLLVRFNLLITETPLPEAFSIVGMLWVSCTVAVLAMFVCTFCSSLGLSRTFRYVTRLCSDGIFYAPSGGIQTNTAYKIVLFASVYLCTSLCALLFRTTHLVLVAALIALVRSSSVTFVTIMLRYREPDLYARSPVKLSNPRTMTTVGTSGGSASPEDGYGSLTPSSECSSDQASRSTRQYDSLTGTNQDDDSSDPDIDELVEEYKDSVRVRRWKRKRQTDGNQPTEATALRAAWALAGFLLCFIGLCVLLEQASSTIRQGNVGTILALLLVLAALTATLVLLLSQPRDSAGLCDVAFSAPAMPWSGLVAMTLTVFLATKAGAWIWAAAIFWMLPGCLVYFLYGMEHSRLAAEPATMDEEERGLLYHPDIQGPDVLTHMHNESRNPP